MTDEAVSQEGQSVSEGVDQPAPDGSVYQLFLSLKAEMAELEKDVKKNSLKRNVSAGVRIRKGLRGVRKLAAEILKVSLDKDKAVIDERKVKNAAKKSETPAT